VDKRDSGEASVARLDRSPELSVTRCWTKSGEFPPREGWSAPRRDAIFGLRGGDVICSVLVAPYRQPRAAPRDRLSPRPISTLPSWPIIEILPFPTFFPPPDFRFGKALSGESGDATFAGGGVVSQLNPRVYAARVGEARDQARDEVGVSGGDLGRFALTLSNSLGRVTPS
jgi:hypothetical protein